MPDNARLEAELCRLYDALVRVASGPRGKGLIDDLRGATSGTTEDILWQALLADCLRIIYSAVMADGEICNEEIDAFHDFVALAASHYAVVLRAQYGEFGEVAAAEARAFLDRYAADRGPFGRGARLHWPGLALCRRAAELGERQPLQRYETTMLWLVEEACRVGGVTERDPRWRGRIDELDELRRLLAGGDVAAAPAVDRRVQAFLTPTRVFTAVQQASSVFENDPFDVDTVHLEARTSFEQLVARATTRSAITDRGRMMLVLGDSGAGKTHLLRGFRRHVQEESRGFIVYAQLQSSSESYSRYLLINLVESLSKRYSERSENTGLRELAGGLLQLASPAVRKRGDQLADDTWDGPGDLADYVNALVDDLIEEGGLGSFDPDLLRIMMYALRRDQKTTSRVYKYLRCDPMTPHDRRLIGDIVPRTGDDHPYWMTRELGRLAALTGRALVLMVDQADLAGFESNSTTMFKRAVDALYRIVSETPSAVAVIACLSDLWETVRGELNRPAIDRLVRDPPISRLQINRTYPEIESVVARRLSWLFAEHGTVHRPEAPVYPIPQRELQQQEHRRLRDVLEWCHQFQIQCAAAGKIISSDEEVVVVKPKAAESDLDQIAAAWHDATHAQGFDAPDEDHEILEVVGAAAKAYADEVGLALAMSSTPAGVLRIQLSAGDRRWNLAIAVTNGRPARGQFPRQIEVLRKAVQDAYRVAIRTLEFPRGAACDKAMAQLMDVGGQGLYVDDPTLRILAAFQRFQPPFSADRVAVWQRRDRPISSLGSVAKIFEQRAATPDGLLAPASAVVDAASVPVEASPATSSSIEAAGSVGTPDANELSQRGSRAASVTVSDSGVRRPRGPKAAAAARGARAVTAAPDPEPPGGSSLPTRLVPGSEATPPWSPAASAPIAAAEPVWRGAPELEPNPRGIRTPRAPIAAGPVPAELAAPKPVVARSAAVDAHVLPRIPRMPSAPPISAEPAPQRASSPARVTPAPSPPPATPLHVGNSTSIEQPEPRTLALSALLRHTAILGGSGSDKTALALTLIEQALERDVSVILLDRRGDLSGYANPTWWQRAGDRARARRLAERIDVRLYTPGLRGGRPLSLAVIPDLAQVPVDDCARIVQRAASALAAIMRSVGGVVDPARLAILTEAIVVLSERATSSGLAELIALVANRDAELVARARGYDERLFQRLAGDLQKLLGELGPLDPGAEPLTAETLIGRSTSGKVPLAIVNTQLLDAPQLQSWVAHVIACVSCDAARLPSSVLRTMFVVDEANLFLPAGVAKPPAKEPLQDLLRQAQAGGIGIVLASQNPADLDYRSRELIDTWFLGRIDDPRSIEKMKPVYEHRPLIRGKLGKLESRRFVMLQDGGAVDLERGPSLMQAEPFAEPELLALAAQTSARQREADPLAPTATQSPR
jgi:energy-coupling factor transporter ATP-binding protein EcfA2